LPGAPEPDTAFGTAVALAGDANTAIVGGPAANSGKGEIFAFATGPTVTPGPNQALLYSPGSAPVTLAPALTALAETSPTLSSATVTLPGTGLRTGADDYEQGDVLAATTAGTGIAATYVDGILRLSGTAPLATYQTVLRSVTFSSTATSGGPR